MHYDSPLRLLPDFPPLVLPELHPDPLRVLHPVHRQRHLLSQALKEVVQLLSLSTTKVIVSLAESEVDLNSSIKMMTTCTFPPTRELPWAHLLISVPIPADFQLLPSFRGIL